MDNKNYRLAYCLGYIAWGNCATNKYYFTINVKPENVAILKYFKNTFKTNYNICHNSCYNRVLLHFNKKFIEKVLDTYYYGARTLLKHRFPPNLPRSLFPAYMRGYFEKHGSISLSSKCSATSGDIRISLPNEDFAIKLRNRLTKEKISTRVLVNKSKGHKTTYKLLICPESKLDFYRMIYQHNFGPTLPIRKKYQTLFLSNTLNNKDLGYYL